MSLSSSEFTSGSLCSGNGDRPVIDKFDDDFRFLSNFYSSTFFFGGVKYATVEHAYQAHKTLDPLARRTITNTKTPLLAKKFGRMVELRSDWNLVKVPLMRELVRLKFENPFLAELLLSTGDAELIEENFWGDAFWGVCDGVGENMLGKILMETREKLVKEREENEQCNFDAGRGKVEK